MKNSILSATIICFAIGSQVHAEGIDQTAAKEETKQNDHSDETFSFQYHRKDLNSPEAMKALKQRLSSEIEKHCQVMAHHNNGPALSEEGFKEACIRVVENEAFSGIEDQSVKFSKFAENAGK